MRFLLQLIRADFYNPISQLVVKLTNPLLVPLRRIIPGFKGVDWACLVCLLLITMLKMTIIIAIEHQRFPNSIGLILCSVADIISLTVNIFFIAIIVKVIISWVNPHTYHPIINLIHGLTHPLIKPIRRFVPIISGLDLSPFVALLGLKLLTILVATPLLMLGFQLSIGG